MNQLKMFRKRSLSNELFLIFPSKGQNLTAFSIIYMIRIRFFKRLVTAGTRGTDFGACVCADPAVTALREVVIPYAIRPRRLRRDAAQKSNTFRRVLWASGHNGICRWCLAFSLKVTTLASISIWGTPSFWLPWLLLRFCCVEGLNPAPHIHEQMTTSNYGYDTAYTFTQNNITLEHNAMNNMNTVAHMNVHNTQY